MGQNLGGVDWDPGTGVALDGSGNVYVTGAFVGTVDFDPGSGTDYHTMHGLYDAYLSKFNSNGNFEWAKTWGATIGYGAQGVGIAAEGSGNACVIGTFVGKVDFDPGSGIDYHSTPYFSDSNQNIFLSTFPPDGNW